MPKWEYTWCYAEHAKESGYVVASPGEPPRPLKDALDTAGSLGWELVSVVPHHVRRSGSLVAAEWETRTSVPEALAAKEYEHSEDEELVDWLVLCFKREVLESPSEAEQEAQGPAEKNKHGHDD